MARYEGSSRDNVHSPAIYRPTIVVNPAPINPQSIKVYVQQPPKTNRLLDSATYAPAIPGVIVALFGLYAAHKLAQWRDRDKNIVDLCDGLKDLADSAAESAIEAWLESSSTPRLLMVHTAKQKIQALGIAATNLSLRSHNHGKSSFNKLSIKEKWTTKTLLEKRKIDVIKQVSSFRRAADADPFEDPHRGSDSTRIPKITKALANITSEVDRSLTSYNA